MRSAARPVAGLVLVALAVLLAVAAVEVWRWPGRARAADAQLLAPGLPPQSDWQGMRGPPSLLLGADDDVTFRRAMVNFRRGRRLDPAGSKDTDEIVSTVSATVALGAIEHNASRSAVSRSEAANLEAILLAEDAVFAPDGEARAREARDLFERAIREDPSNDAAKTNLELLLLVSGSTGASDESTSRFGGFGNNSGSAGAGGGY